MDAQDWNARYLNNNAPWDLSGATPEFTRLANEGFFQKGRRAIVPGGGNGHDAILLAQHGLEVDLVDFAPAAINGALELASHARTVIHAFRQDFFELGSLPYHKNSYDYFLEYTFYCAIDPKLRETYVKTAAALVKSGGVFVGLFFPLTSEKEPPPFIITQDEVEKLFRPYFDFKIETPKESVKARAGREFLFIGKRK